LPHLPAPEIFVWAAAAAARHNPIVTIFFILGISFLPHTKRRAHSDFRRRAFTMISTCRNSTSSASA
jgi:hypothetical protein